MSQQTLTARGRRFRMLAGALLGAGLLLIASACGDKGGDTPSGGANGGSDVLSKVAALKVCELVDLKELASTLNSTGYTNGPSDVAKGSGKDPDGPQCFAQMTMPELGSNVTVPTIVNAAVVAYPTATEAATQLAQRTAKSDPSDVTTDLTGDWTKGVLLARPGTSNSLVLGVVQKDSYLVVLEVQVPSDAAFGTDKWPFTLDQVKTTVTETIGKFYTSASGKIAG